MSTVQRLNLAQRPFSNRSPRRRLRVILWTAAGLLMVLNSFLFAQYWISSSSSREELRAVRERSDEQVETMRELQQRLAAVDLETQNEQVRFLNRKIAERTFPWSDLFDDLAAVLPRDVRLLSIAPGIEDDSKKRRGQDLATSIDWIGLEVIARAKKSDDVLNLIDAMFEHPSFAGPTLAQENLKEGEIEFNASVRYRVAPLLPESLDESAEVVIADEEPGGELSAQPSGARSSGEGRGADPDSPPGPVTRRSSGGSQSAGDVAGLRSPSGAAADPGAERAARPATPSSSLAEGVPTAAESAGTQSASTRAGQPVAADPSASASTRGSASRTAPTRPRDEAVPVAAPGTAEAIADERYGRGQPRAPRIPNASGNNGGAR